MVRSTICVYDGHLCLYLADMSLSVYAVDNIRYICPFLQDLVGCRRHLFVLPLFVGVSSKPFLFLCFFCALFGNRHDLGSSCWVYTFRYCSAFIIKVTDNIVFFCVFNCLFKY